MKSLSSNIIKKLPYQNLKKVSDLININGSLLSHFTDESAANILYLKVDSDNEFNRFLIFKVGERDLASYLDAKSSLKDLILFGTSEFIFTADIKQKNKHKNINLFHKTQIESIQEYIPGNESFFQDEQPSIYIPLIEKFKDDLYLSELKSRAVYFKLESDDVKFGKTVRIKDVKNFLDLFIKSFSTYSMVKFKQDLKETFPTYEKLEKAAKLISPNLEPRIVDLEYRSFSFAISTDYIMQSASIPKVKSWTKKILNKYIKEVIEINYDSEQEVNGIINKFSDDDRRKIYEPIFKAINNPSYTVNTTNRKYIKIREITLPNTDSIDKIIPPLQKQVESRKDLKLVNLVVEIPKEGKISSIRKKSFEEGVLFSKEVNQFSASIERLDTNTHEIILSNPIEFEIKLINNIYFVSYPRLNIELEVDDKKNISKVLSEKILNLFNNLISTPNRSNEEEKNLNFLKKLFKEFIRIK